MAVTFHGAIHSGLSGDTKPSSNLSAGDLFVETNTDKIFQWNGSAWDAVTVADEAITEAKLYISNNGANGQFLSKQSGNNGGLTWATPASNAFAFFIS